MERELLDAARHSVMAAILILRRVGLAIPLLHAIRLLFVSEAFVTATFHLTMARQSSEGVLLQ